MRVRGGWCAGLGIGAGRSSGNRAGDDGGRGIRDVPGPYITTDQLLDFVAGTIHVPVVDLPVDFDGLAQNAVAISYTDLLGIYCLKAYTIAQLDSSDQAVPYSLSQGLFRLGQSVREWGNVPPPNYESYDLRKVLAEAGQPVLTVAGVALAPSSAASAIGGISTGRQAGYAASNAAFNARWGYGYPCYGWGYR